MTAALINAGISPIAAAATAHDAAAAPAGEAAYVQSIERLEGSTVVIGKALE